MAEPASSDGDFLAATHAGAERALSELQFILSDARLNETSVAWLTSGAVATGPEEGVAGLSRAPLWGLVRSARAEHPDRQLQLLDVDAPPAEAALLAKLLSTAAEPELALRHGSVVAPRLVRAEEGTGALRAPAGAEDYRVAVTHPGRLDGVSLVAAPELLSEPLAPGQVRVSVRAAGMNFRDVLIALGMIEVHLGSGFEFAGVVEAVGEGVDFVVGWRSSARLGERVLWNASGYHRRALASCESRQGCPSRQAATVPLVYHDGVVCAARPRATSRRASGCWFTRRRAAWGWPRCSSAGTSGPRCMARRARASGRCWKGWDWMRGTSRVRATLSFETEIPVGNGWRGSGCRPQLADG